MSKLWVGEGDPHRPAYVEPEVGEDAVCVEHVLKTPGGQCNFGGPLPNQQHTLEESGGRRLMVDIVQENVDHMRTQQRIQRAIPPDAHHDKEGAGAQHL